MQMKLIWRWVISQLYWRVRLTAIGSRSVIFAPLLINNPQYIRIGDRVSVRDGARLEIVKVPGATWTPALSIGNHVNIEQGAHIVCQCSIEIEDNVSITPYCVIVDTYHPFDLPDMLPKIGDRLPDQPTHVRIGMGSFIGAHSVILPNVTIGKGCVIGAGSVVVTNVPDYSIAVGSPARVVKTFNVVSRTWQPVEQRQFE